MPKGNNQKFKLYDAIGHYACPDVLELKVNEK